MAGPPEQLLALALVMLVIAAATILGALGFQYIGGYEPCMLCLMQRTPYYAGIPLVAAAGIAVWLKAPRWLIALLFAVFGLLFIYETGLAVYHSGVEWGFWEGPASCSQALAGAHGAAAMLSQLDAVTPASCYAGGLALPGSVLRGMERADLRAAGAARPPCRACWLGRRRSLYGSSSASQ